MVSSRSIQPETLCISGFTADALVKVPQSGSAEGGYMVLHPEDKTKSFLGDLIRMDYAINLVSALNAGHSPAGAPDDLYNLRFLVLGFSGSPSIGVVPLYVMVLHRREEINVWERVVVLHLLFDIRSNLGCNISKVLELKSKGPMAKGMEVNGWRWEETRVG